MRRCLRPLNLIDEAASFLPPRLRPPVQATTEAVRRLGRLARIRYPLRRLEGAAPGDAGRLVCLLATDELSARYWASTLFAEPPAEDLVGDVPALGVARAARRYAGGADVSFWQAPWPVYTLAGAARVPSWLPLWLATDRPIEEVIAGERSGRAARKNDVRRVQRLGLEVRVASDAADWERFRRELYEPYVAERFGELRVALPPHAFHQARRNGWLLLVERDGVPLAGALLERWGRDTRVLVFGVATRADIPAGALLEACYYHAIRFAVEHGFRRLSLGTCRPVLTDGVLRYKRKWGGTIGAPATWDAFLLRYRNTPAVRALLGAVPLVLERGDGKLAALVGTRGGDATDLATHVHRLDAPGLAELACLVESAVTVPADFGARHSSLRVVPPGAVWPSEAAA